MLLTLEHVQANANVKLFVCFFVGNPRFLYSASLAQSPGRTTNSVGARRIDDELTCITKAIGL